MLVVVLDSVLVTLVVVVVEESSSQLIVVRALSNDTLGEFPSWRTDKHKRCSRCGSDRTQEIGL